jgi:hypothetical protein
MKVFNFNIIYCNKKELFKLYFRGILKCIKNLPLDLELKSGLINKFRRYA